MRIIISADVKIIKKKEEVTHEFQLIYVWNSSPISFCVAACFAKSLIN